MGQFPRDREKAAALIVGSSIIAGIIQADKVVVKTVEEALGVPNAQVNAEAIKAVRYAMNTFDAADRLDSEAVHREATLIRSQALCILNAIYNMPGESFWESVFRAFQKGYIDLPFSPHADNANKLNCIRDANRSIRIVNPGNLPISDFDMQQELALLKTGDGSTRETAARLLSDINVMVQ
jgi:methylaspartate mutase epsilon subunit